MPTKRTTYHSTTPTGIVTSKWTVSYLNRNKKTCSPTAGPLTKRDTGEIKKEWCSYHQDLLLRRLFDYITTTSLLATLESERRSNLSNETTGGKTYEKMSLIISPVATNVNATNPKGPRNEHPLIRTKYQLALSKSFL